MHLTSLENMQKCYETFICSNYFDTKARFSVLDLTADTISGSYRDIFSEPKFEYCAINLEPHVAIDAPSDTAYSLPHPDGSIDIIVSGPAFAQSQKFWLLFAEMARIVASDGFIILIAPSVGPVCSGSVESYRFCLNAYAALAHESCLHLVQSVYDDRGESRDLVGVFSKTPDHSDRRNNIWRPLKAAQRNKFYDAHQQLPTPPKDLSDQAALIEAVRGAAHKYDLLGSIHDWLQPSLYLEIGVDRGHSLLHAKGEAIAIDPDPQCSNADFPNAKFFSVSSDYYFENHWPSEDVSRSIDLALIDGMHLSEFVLRDFINIEKRSNAQTVVLIDDVYPNHPVQCQRVRKSRTWTGDVWKFYVLLREIRPDLDLTVLDVRPTGLLMVRGLDRHSRLLSDHYELMVRRFEALDIENYSALIFDRDEAATVDAANFRLFLDALPSAPESRRDLAVFPNSDGSYEQLLNFSRSIVDAFDASKALASVAGEKEELIREKGKLIREKDELIREKDELIREKDELIREKDELNKQRRQLKLDLKKTSAERAAVQQTLDAVLKSKLWRWTRWLRFL